MNKGVYSDGDIKDLINLGIINTGPQSSNESQFQPSSFDLRIGGHFYCLPYSGFPKKGESLETYFKRISKYDFHIDGSEVGFLHKKNVYAVKIQESLNLPDSIFAKVNPKSSIGRVDLHVRLVTENGNTFDQIPNGYKGDLWLELYPRSFDIELSKGTTLNQVMFFDSGLVQESKASLISMNNESGIIYDSNNIKCPEEIMQDLISENTVKMTVSVGSGVIGYSSRSDAPPVNLNRRDLRAQDYFTPVISKNGSFVVDPDSFYILSSNEIINIPVSTCAVMVDVDTNLGEFRGHYAGFFDPGFRAQAVLELRNYGSPFILKNGQTVSGLKFFKMKSIPRVSYGSDQKLSNYQGQQGPRLAKYFNL